MLRQLLKSPGWAEVRKIADAWIEQKRQATSEAPIASQEEAYQRNVDIGMVRGMLAVVGLPEAQVNNLESIIEKIRQEESDEPSSDD